MRTISSVRLFIYLFIADFIDVDVATSTHCELFAHCHVFSSHDGVFPSFVAVVDGWKLEENRISICEYAVL